jgi:hypothetical protein
MIKEGASMMIMAIIKAAIVTGYSILSDFFHIRSIIGLALLATRFISHGILWSFPDPIALSNILYVNLMTHVSELNMFFFVMHSDCKCYIFLL